MVVIKLKSIKKKVNSTPTSQLTNNFLLVNKAVTFSVVRRVVWYPVVPFVSQFFYSFTQTYAYVNHKFSYTLLLFSFLGASLQGLLNALAFSQDTAVIHAFMATKLRWWIYIVNSYESQYPHLSHNKAITYEFSTLGKSIAESKTLNYNKADSIKKNIINQDINNIINNDNKNNPINNGVINTNNNNLALQPSFLEWLKYMLLIKLFSAPEDSPRLISPKLLLKIDSPAENMQMHRSIQEIIHDNQNNEIIHNDKDNYLIHPEPIHSKQASPLDVSSNCLNQETSFNLLIGSSNQNNISNVNNKRVANRTIDEEEEQIDAIVVNPEQTKNVTEASLKRISSDTDLSQEIEISMQIVKRL
ncbi:12219_t:CDS:2 [Cetraspora pellucida]|uniref:12219_t:CDS:1 n=1 Tax=Cetraspora pellucida TaxID=1433469 RepID=A0A9N9BED6_9GLOM|nr:12219_t:CDS:2 [Cetraspora pellucida]